MALPSRAHLHTFAYVLLHLQRVASHAETNFMHPKNLALCIFITAKEGGEYLVRYADVVFGNVDLVGRSTVAGLPKAAASIPAESITRHTLPRAGSGISIMEKWFENVAKPVEVTEPPAIVHTPIAASPLLQRIKSTNPRSLDLSDPQQNVKIASPLMAGRSSTPTRAHTFFAVVAEPSVNSSILTAANMSPDLLSVTALTPKSYSKSAGGSVNSSVNRLTSVVSRCSSDGSGMVSTRSVGVCSVLAVNGDSVDSANSKSSK
ncbi:hypothetical protein HDU98_012258 [Podochytrium sp. JEL0797]|nr:hypothetical protein HDU98_012258 [Podochytrium sp. JEL0797]